MSVGLGSVVNEDSSILRRIVVMLSLEMIKWSKEKAASRVEAPV